MIDQELKQRALTPAAKGEAAPREKILKLGKRSRTSSTTSSARCARKTRNTGGWPAS